MFVQVVGRRDRGTGMVCDTCRPDELRAQWKRRQARARQLAG
jgi:hypothetical protein